MITRLAVLSVLLVAIRETASASRVIITSRYGFLLPGPARLVAEALASMRGADLDKKVEQLETLESTRRSDPALAERLIMAGAGNPRLLERLETLVSNLQADAEEILDAVEGEAEEFREELLLAAILERQEPGLRRLVAYASIFDVPVQRSTVAAAAGDDLINQYLDRAVSLGLIETGSSLGGSEVFHLVSTLVRPLVHDELSEVESSVARSRAARHLFDLWNTQNLNEDLLLETHRLAVSSDESEVALKISDKVATQWLNRSRFREAESLTLQTLTVRTDFRLLHNLARAEERLGKTTAARDHYEAALAASYAEQSMEGASERLAILLNSAGLVLNQGELERALHLFQESLEFAEEIGDTHGKAATLHHMAIIYAQQGELARSLQLLQQSLSLEEGSGLVRGKAATLHQMAIIYDRQGDLKRALQFYQQSLDLEEQIGNVAGKAATLHQMAGIYAQFGEQERALQLYQQSLNLKEEVEDVLGKAATLHQMAVIYAEGGESEHALELLRQTLDLDEKVGNVQGKAVTLAQVATLLFQQGKRDEAITHLIEAATVLAGVRDWPNLARTLGNLATFDASNSTYVLQAAWIAFHVWIPIEENIPLAYAAIKRFGLNTPAAQVLAGAAVVTIIQRTEQHPEAKSLREQAFNLLAATAAAVDIEPGKLIGWIVAERLLDAEYVIARALQELEARVPEDQWLFDRRLVASSSNSPESPVDAHHHH
jgi:tetratricopeptide (TPR) repeat protein